MMTQLQKEQYHAHEFIATRHADWFATRGPDAQRRFLLVGYRGAIETAVRCGNTQGVRRLLARVRRLGLDDREFLHLYPKWSWRRIVASLRRRLCG